MAVCNKIIIYAECPEDFSTSRYIPIYKKGDSKECSNCKPIALISHASKIALSIIHQRMQQQYEREISAMQAGFRR